MIWLGWARFNQAWHDEAWHDMTRCDGVWLGMAGMNLFSGRGLAWRDEVWLDGTRYDQAR